MISRSSSDTGSAAGGGGAGAPARSPSAVTYICAWCGWNGNGRAGESIPCPDCGAPAAQRTIEIEYSSDPVVVTIGRSEAALRFEQKLAQAYQVIGYLLHQCGLFESDEGQRALDYFSDISAFDVDFLPWPGERETKK